MLKIDNFHASLKDNLLSNHPEIIGPSFSDLFPPKKWKRPQKIDFFKKGRAYIRTIRSLLLFCRSTLVFLLAGLGNELMSGSCHLDRASNVKIDVECQILYEFL